MQGYDQSLFADLAGLSAAGSRQKFGCKFDGGENKKGVVAVVNFDEPMAILGVHHLKIQKQTASLNGVQAYLHVFIAIFCPALEDNVSWWLSEVFILLQTVVKICFLKEGILREEFDWEFCLCSLDVGLQELEYFGSNVVKTAGFCRVQRGGETCQKNSIFGGLKDKAGPKQKM